MKTSRQRIDSSLQEFHENTDEAVRETLAYWVMERYTQLLSNSGISKERADQEWSRVLDWLRAETEASYHLRGLRRAAYARYSDGKLLPASQTCIKTLGTLCHFERTTRHSGSGEAEIWFMVAHMYACAGKFKIAKTLLRAAKKGAREDQAIHRRDSYRGSHNDSISRPVWNATIAALSHNIKFKVPQGPIAHFSQAEFRVRSKIRLPVPPFAPLAGSAVCKDTDAICEELGSWQNRSPRLKPNSGALGTRSKRATTPKF